MLEITGIGYLGKNAELKEDKDKKMYVAFNVGCKKPDGSTEWIYCRKEGEYFNDLVKGTGIFFRGTPFCFHLKDQNTGDLKIMIGCHITFMRVTNIPYEHRKPYNPTQHPSVTHTSKPLQISESDRQKVVGDGLKPRARFDSVPPADDDLPF